MKNQYLIFFALSMELVALELVLIFLGQYLDQKYGWNGIGIISGAMIGLFAWLAHMVMAIKKITKEDSVD